MRKRQTLAGSVRQWVSLVLVSMVILAMSAILLAAVVVPRLGGATPYTILTGSMTPAMPPGTLVVAKPIDADDIATGMVVTYQIASGKPDVVTHRVISQGIDGTGRPIFRTQGDANDVADENWVRPEQIRGARWYYVPYIGYVSNVLTGAQRHLGVLVVGGGLLAYATAMFGGALAEKKKKIDEIRRCRRHEPVRDPSPHHDRVDGRSDGSSCC